jgi:uncharacterized protein YijF (DUF1287 family)
MPILANPQKRQIQLAPYQRLRTGENRHDPLCRTAALDVQRGNDAAKLVRRAKILNFLGNGSLFSKVYGTQRAANPLMARSKPGFYNTIEYIGPRPQKPKRPNFFGGWVIVVIAVGIACWFGRPLIPFLRAAQEGVSMEQAEILIQSLATSDDSGDRLAAAALAYSGEGVTYDPSYYKISYPNGDVASGKGNAADVVIRCLRRTGIDLQKEVHEDMAQHFRLYPQIWGALAPDANIDHRRVANLQRFLERKGQTLPASREASDYRPGDIVIWSLANAEQHIGIVVPGPGNRSHEMWVVHHLGSGVKWENVLFDFKVAAHFRYPVATAEKAGSAE